MSRHSFFGGAVAAVIATCLAAPLPAVAQPTTPIVQPVAVVLKGGIAIDGSHMSSPGVPGTLSATGTGFVGGLAFTMPANRRLAFQLEFLVNERTAVSIPANTPPGNVPLIVVPFFLRTRLSETNRTRIGLLVGVESAVQLTRSANGDRQDEDYGAILGVDVDLRPRLVLDLRYTRGLVSLEPRAEARESVKNRGFTAMLGWRIY